MEEIMKKQAEEEQDDLFQIALDYLLSEGGYGSGKMCAEFVGIKPAYLSQIRHGVKRGSPEIREKIVDSFMMAGMDYETFKELGRWLLDSEDPDYFINYLGQTSELDDQINLKLHFIFNFDGTVSLSRKNKLAADLGRVLLERELLSKGFKDGHLQIGLEEDYNEMLNSVLDNDILDAEKRYNEFTNVPKYKAKLSGGPGSFEISDQVEANMMFKTDFLSRKGQVDKMSLFEVAGESMQPFIYHGDVVLVDRSVNTANQIVDGKVYAFRDDGTVLIKRLSRQGKMIIASSENHQMNPPYHVDLESFHLIGRVVWVGHEVR